MNAHMQLVREVMDSLASSMGDRGISEEEMPIAPAAVEIVASVMSQDWLVHDGQIHLVRSVTKNVGAYDSTLIVQISSDASDLRCRWCVRLYGIADPGASHGLCKNCYQYGPSVSNKD